MGCANGRNIVAPQKSNKISPFDDKNVSPVKGENNVPATLASQNNDAIKDPNNAKKHYLPQQILTQNKEKIEQFQYQIFYKSKKKRVKETITIKQATDVELTPKSYRQYIHKHSDKIIIY